MRIFSKTAVAVAAAGLAVFGTVAAGGGVAHAATDQSVTGCQIGSNTLAGLGGGLLSLGVAPACSGPDSTVVNPTSITVTADPDFFTVLGNTGVANLLARLGLLQEHITYTLECSVNGTTATANESFTAAPGSESQTVNLQDAVGSPVPNSCTVHDLTATSLLSLSSALITALRGLNLLTNLTFGVTATANTAVSGAIYSVGGHTSTELTANICADDTGNANAVSAIQVYQCNSDLAQSWVQASTGQLVRNGDCMTQDGSDINLDLCTASTADQVWDVKGTGGTFDEIVNSATGDCLTWPSSAMHTQLTAVACVSGQADQQWTGPAPSAM